MAMNAASMTNILAFELPRGSTSTGGSGSTGTSKTVTEKNSQKSGSAVNLHDAAEEKAVPVV